VSPAAVSTCCVHSLCRHRVSTAVVSPRCVHSYCVLHAVFRASVSPQYAHSCCVATVCRQLLCRHTMFTASVSPQSNHSCCANTVCPQLMCRHTVSIAAVSPRCVHSSCVTTECPQQLRHRAVYTATVSPRCVHGCRVATLCSQLLCRHSVSTAVVSTMPRAAVSPHCVVNIRRKRNIRLWLTNHISQKDGWTHFQASNISQHSLQFPSRKSLQPIVTDDPGSNPDQKYARRRETGKFTIWKNKVTSLDSSKRFRFL
jgi:hypothetical protein